MPSPTFYRKYRPQHFSDVIGQKHVVRTLENALKLGRVGQAYLLTGPRGTGKTTLARLFAKAVNCSHRKGAEPCDTCEHCRLVAEGRSLDIIEIDAASHTGVDNIRDLRDTVKLLPTTGSHKVYIIDEVHMLSTGAFNALLKTLEEPPAHVIFILATTEIHKVPETILSRCQRFDLSRFPVKNIEEKLALIAKAEKIKASGSALRMIAEIAEGGMRDAESILTQVANLADGAISDETVSALFGSSQTEILIGFTTALADKDMFAALRIAGKLSEDGSDLSVFTGSLLNFLRKVLLASAAPKEAKTLFEDISETEREAIMLLGTRFASRDIARMLELFQEARRDIRNSALPELPIEIAIVKTLDPIDSVDILPKQPSRNIPSRNSSPLVSTSPPPSAPSLAPQSKIVQKNSPRDTPSDTKEAQVVPENIPKKVSGPAAFSLDEIVAAWNSILEQTKILNASVAVALVQTKPLEVRGKTLVLHTRHNFHKERLDQPQSRLTLSEAFGRILSFEPQFLIVLSEDQSATGKTVPKEPSSLVSQALEMLGGKLAGTESPGS